MENKNEATEQEPDHAVAGQVDVPVMCDWPTKPGIWMGKITDSSWFPMQAKLLKEYQEGEVHLPMPIVTQYPESETRWPFTVKECHPINEWREPTAEELTQAKVFYGLKGK